MYRFFEYCFYRIATTKYFQKVDPKYTWTWAFGWTSFCELLNVLTIVGIYQIFTNVTFEVKSLVIAVSIPIYITNLLLLTEKKYKWMVEHYKDEKNKKLKGWWVVLYVLGSMIAFAITRIILF